VSTASLHPARGEESDELANDPACFGEVLEAMEIQALLVFRTTGPDPSLEHARAD